MAQSPRDTVSGSAASPAPADSATGAASVPATPAESQFSTPAADPAQAPSQRRAQVDAPRMRAAAAKLEDLQHRVAHLLGADDLAALAAVLADLQAMAPADPPPAAP